MDNRIQKEHFNRTSEERLSIEVTTHCNRACRHCFVHATLLEKNSLSLEQVKEIIAEGYQVGYRRLHITGGEPFLWTNLFMALDFAFELGFQNVLLNTNGSFLTKDINRRLSKYTDLSLSVSLEGTPAFHLLLRQNNDYQHIYKAVERALEAGLNLFIFTTVGKTLIKDLPSFTLALYERLPEILGLSLIQLIRPTKEAFDLSNELLRPADFVKLVKIASLLNLYGHKTEILNNPLAVVVSKRLKLPLIPRVPSLQRNRHLMVRANRQIYLAHSVSKCFGIFKPGMIERVFSSNEYLIGVSQDEAICPSCKYSKLCMENGLRRPSEWFRDMHPEIPYCKRVMSIVDSERSQLQNAYQ